MLEIEEAAFVLHRRPLGEHQFIVDLLTQSLGKVSAVVYASKSAKFNKNALLQPFLPVSIVLKGKGELKKLSRIESTQKSYSLVGNYLYSGLYLNELMVKLLGESLTSDDLYEQYTQSLRDLSEQKPIEIILRKFERCILEELGLSFDFEPAFTQSTNALHYVHEEGFIPALSNRTLPCYDTKHIQAIAQEQLEDSQVLRTYKLLMRQILNQLLGHKPLNSRKLFTR